MTISIRKLLKRYAKHSHPYNDPLADRADLAALIRRCEEKGQILIVESGRDCDGAYWQGRTFLLPASVMAFIKARDDKAAWADGPFNWVVEKPSRESEYSYHSRDLALEAFEDGHPHVLYSPFL